MKTQNIFLKVDTNEEIGGGHLHRCKALALEFKKRKNINISFLFSNTPHNEIDKLRSLNYNIYQIDKEKQFDIKEYLNIIPKDSLLIFDTDNPNFYSGRLVELLEKYHIKTACFTISDKYRITTDILINTNLISLYQEFNTKPSTTQILGPKYLIFNQEFQQLSDFTKETSSGNNLFVFFGNADANHITIFFIDILKKLNHLFNNINILIGSLNNDTSIIEEEIKYTPFIKIHKNLDANQIINLFKKTSLIITAAGMTMWEAALFEIPQIVVASSEREILYTNLLSEMKYIYKLCNYKELTDQDILLKKIKDVIESEKIKHLNTLRFRETIAHDGIIKLCDKILETI